MYLPSKAIAALHHAKLSQLTPGADDEDEASSDSGENSSGGEVEWLRTRKRGWSSDVVDEEEALNASRLSRALGFQLTRRQRMAGSWRFYED